jgi:hypothetical protein
MYDDDGKARCKSCPPGEEASHECPSCKCKINGAGNFKCSECTIQERGSRQIYFNTPLFVSKAFKELFLSYSTELLLINKNPSICNRINLAASFFYCLEKKFDTLVEITQIDLLELFKPEGLRKNTDALSYLIDNLSLYWDSDVSLNYAEEYRVKTKMLSIQNKPWAETLQRYYDNLLTHTQVSYRTIRYYLNAAERFLEEKWDRYKLDIPLTVAQQYYLVNKGQRASVRAFFKFLNIKINGYHKVKRSMRKVRLNENRILSNLNLYFSVLQSENTYGTYKSALSLALAELFQLSLRKVLTIKICDISLIKFHFKLAGIKYGYPHELKIFFELVLKLHTFKSDYLFEGRAVGSSYSSSAVLYNKKLINIQLS